MTDERKNLFSRGDIWAVLFLLACILIGSTMMIFQKHNHRLPPELLIETVKNSAHSDKKHTATQTNSSSALQNIKININHAPADSLELLPGIGPKYATQIVQYRLANGNFDSIEELTEIPGIGPKTIAKIGQFLTVE